MDNLASERDKWKLNGCWVCFMTTDQITEPMTERICHGKEITWTQLCEFSRNVTNEAPTDDMHDHLVYLSDNSMSCRRMLIEHPTSSDDFDADETLHSIEWSALALDRVADNFSGHWVGYQRPTPNASYGFLWESTSGSIARALPVYHSQGETRFYVTIEPSAGDSCFYSRTLSR